MGCCGGEREKGPVTAEQKWDYITLSDFRSKSCIAPFSYIWLWILVFAAIAVYVADTFTAVNLIAFNKWSSQVEPTIPFEISKWIFFVCICLSWALCALEWLRAIRVMRGGGVADSYLDPLAAVLQSIRLGQGKGWRRFLVFAELTKSKKGTDYIALFVYFQFKGAIRIILAEGPRQVVNAFTLYSVMKLNLIPEGKNASTDGHSAVEQFFLNIEALADSNHLQAVILSSMLFTLVIWVISALSLLVALILYLLFLWHYIPSADGTLSRYCRRKVDARLEKIVGVKVQKALQRQEAKRLKEEQKAVNRAKKDGEKVSPTALGQKPTLPSIGGSSDDDARSEFGLNRQESFATLPPYTSQPPTRTNTMATNTSNPPRPFPPSRSATQSSNTSYASNAPLLSDAGAMGYGEPGRSSPVPPLPPLDTVQDYRGAPMNRTMTPGSAGGFGGAQRPFSPMDRVGTPQGQNSPMGMRPYGPGGPSRLNTQFSDDGRNSPGPMGPPGPSRMNPGFDGPDGRNSPGPMGPPRMNTPYGPNGRQSPGPRGPPGPSRMNTPFSADGRNSPAPMGPQGPSRMNMQFNGGDGRNSPSPMGPPGPMPRQNTYGALNIRPVAGPSPLSADPGFSPYERRSPAPGPAYEMSPVEQPHQPPSFTNGGYTTSPVHDDGEYDPYRSAPEPVAPARTYTPYNPGNAGPGPSSTPQPQSRPLPSSVLQSAIQRREASNPLPARGGAASVPPQQVQRSVTAPIDGPMYPQQSPSPVPRAATADPRPRQQPSDGWSNGPGPAEDRW